MILIQEFMPNKSNVTINSDKLTIQFSSLYDDSDYDINYNYLNITTYNYFYTQSSGTLILFRQNNNRCRDLFL